MSMPPPALFSFLKATSRLYPLPSCLSITGENPKLRFGR
jgi:hypothetical protein